MDHLIDSEWPQSASPPQRALTYTSWPSPITSLPPTSMPPTAAANLQPSLPIPPPNPTPSRQQMALPPPADHSTSSSVDHLQVHTYHASITHSQQSCPSLANSGRLKVPGVFEFPPEAPLPAAGMTNPKKSRKQSFPRLPQPGVPEGNQSAKKSRSKSGCLTCRQRHVKCDETRPTCGNCVRSKRECHFPIPNPSARLSPKPAVQCKNVIPQQPDFPHSAASPKNQSPWYALAQPQFPVNTALMTEPQSALQEQQTAQHLQQHNANEPMEDGDMRLLNLLRASIQGDLEYMGRPEYVQPAHLHSEYFDCGETQHTESVTRDHTPNQNVTTNTFLTESSSPEQVCGSFPSKSLPDFEKKDEMALTTTNRYRRRYRQSRKVTPAAQRCGQPGELGIKHSVRDHPLYEKAITGPDGLYHCPWEGKEPLCSHKPEKLKCYYKRFIDAHIKPYRCKFNGCENSRFSSTGILHRHEREAHAIHGIGKKSFLCTTKGCKRGVSGQGFPRYYNLCNHMKRIHHRSMSPPNADRPIRGARKCNSDASMIVAKKGRPHVE